MLFKKIVWYMGLMVTAVNISFFFSIDAKAEEIIELDIGNASEEVDIEGFGGIDIENPVGDLFDTDCGAERIMGNVINTEDIPREEIDAVNFWGYKYLGIAQVSNHLNVRETPGEGGKLVGKMSNDAACEILRVYDNWALIKSGEVTGYASMDYLIIGEEAIEHGKEVASKMAVLKGDGVNVRSEPNTECSIVDQIGKGEELEVVEELDGWIACNVDDETVYVSSDYATVEERLSTAVTMKEILYGNGISDARVEIVSLAQKYIGNPYVWGGTSLTKGVDCSGFTMVLMAKYGVSLPHSAAAQSKMGKAVSLDSLKPGDLVFYGSKSRINHVVMYIGNGQVCHASSKKTGIKISNLYYRKPVCARSFL